jgi:hypothetical protein
MNAVAVAVDKRRHMEELWEKLRGTKTGTPEYKAIVNKIGVLAMEYHQIIDLGKPASQTDLLRSNKIT